MSQSAATIALNDTRSSRRGWRKLALVFVPALFVVFFFAFAGRLLVTDNAQKSDVIVVLAGDSFDQRYTRGMELLRAGYGRQLFVDAATDIHFFGHKPSDLAADFLKTDTGEMAPFVHVCSYRENSTVTETKYVGACLQPLHPADVLLVTSDWHTARALSIFRKKLPQYHWSIAAAHDPTMFDVRWWRHREWAKTTLVEWTKVSWWNCVDRWR